MSQTKIIRLEMVLIIFCSVCSFSIFQKTETKAIVDNTLFDNVDDYINYNKNETRLHQLHNTDVHRVENNILTGTQNVSENDIKNLDIEFATKIFKAKYIIKEHNANKYTLMLEMDILHEKNEPADSEEAILNMKLLISELTREREELVSEMHNVKIKYDELEKQTGEKDKELNHLKFNLSKCDESEMLISKVFLINGLHEQMLADNKSQNWSKSVELMKIHLDRSTQAYKQLNNVVQVDAMYLWRVTSMGYTELIKVMCDNGFPVNTRYINGYTMLHAAAELGHYKLTMFLIQRGADWNDNDNLVGYTPLILAAKYDKLNITRLLVDIGSDINAITKNGETSLYMAAYNGHKSIVQYLVDNGCDTTIRDSWGKTALDVSKSEDIKNIILKQQVNA